MGGKKAKASPALGRTLIKDRFGRKNNRKMVDKDSMFHTTELQDGYDWGRLNLQSVTEESSFQDFLRTAELAGTEFQAEKLNITFVNPNMNAGILSNAERFEIEKKQFDKKDLLKIPRRPKWTSQTTTEELVSNEKQNFLEWRRGLAMLQEEDEMLLTPYEKNLEFWRQLWRVVERSDVIVQIVDARNPLQFWSEDLEKYVKEVNENKLNLILLNKADFLTDSQRIHWAEYFDKQNVKVAFFSALEKEELDNISEKSENDSDNLSTIDSDDSSEDEEDLSINDNKHRSNNSQSEKEEKSITALDIKGASSLLSKLVDKTENQINLIEEKLKISFSLESSSQINCPNILTREELIELFKSLHSGKKVNEGLSTIGLVGYPNVGKSSTINALMTEKKVSVSATPGKTKHFQTLYLDNELLLCDCPGLVFPSFVSTKADMILNGILSIDQMRDHVPPINLLCTQIPRHIIEDKYGIMIAKPQEGEDQNRSPFSEELLLAYGYNRGYMTANGQPDQARSARYVLKDYVNGKLLHCNAPPNITQKEYHTFPERIRIVDPKHVVPPRERRAIKVASSGQTSKDVDDIFFQQKTAQIHATGRTAFPHIRQNGYVGGSTTSLNNIHIIEKPWKQKKEKKEKLRRKFAHLDQH